MTVTFFGLIPRLPALSAQEFHDHYRHPHGSIGARTPGLLNYFQNHQFDTELLGARQNEFEAVAEWQSSSAESVNSAERRAYYRRHTEPDEANFVDLPRMIWLYASVTAVTDNKAARTRTEADLMWDPTVAALSTKALLFLDPTDVETTPVGHATELAFAVGALRFRQSEPHPEFYGASHTPPFAAVREMWWPTRTKAERGASAASAAWMELTQLGSASKALLTQSERFAVVQRANDHHT